jgi:hypothetical protein
MTFFLASCGIDNGRVVAKEYEPAESYSCQVGQVKVGSVTVPIMGTCYEEEEFDLILENQGKRGEVEVTEQEYNDIKLGDWYGQR